jgi:transposase
MEKIEPKTPAQIVIAAFGTNAEVSRILDVSKSTITRWGYTKEEGGTNGLVPQKHWPALLSAAKRRRVKLSLRQLAGL